MRAALFINRPISRRLMGFCPFINAIGFQTILTPYDPADHLHRFGCVRYVLRQPIIPAESRSVMKTGFIGALCAIYLNMPGWIHPYYCLAPSSLAAAKWFDHAHPASC